MSVYVPPSDDVTRESLERLGVHWRRLRRIVAEHQHLNQVVQELVVLADLALQVIEDCGGTAGGEHDSFGEFAAACLRAEGGLDRLDLLDEIAKRARHLRSLTVPTLKSNEPPTLARDAGGSSTKGV